MMVRRGRLVSCLKSGVAREGISGLSVPVACDGNGDLKIAEKDCGVRDELADELFFPPFETTLSLALPVAHGQLA